MLTAELVTILAVFNATLNQFGYEAHPFAVKCYNGIKTMDKKFHLNYTDNTLALTVIAAPDMFEKAMKPFICKPNIDDILKKDPTDECNKYYLKKFFSKYPDTYFLSSYKMFGPGHPAILSQTAAHVSGAAYYYQRKDVPEDTWPANKVRCYNDIKSMNPKFRLNYTQNTLALTVVAAPDMFEKAMIPCICDSNVTALLDGDPTDYCNQKYFKKFFDIYPKTDFLSSYKMLDTGLPVILSQTAAHVSGAAYYYQRRDVPRDTWPANKTIYGVAIHPLYGGWVRFPGVIVFKNVMVPKNFSCLSPPDVVPSIKKRIKLLNEFNDDWGSWKFADIIPVVKKYTPEAKAYFSISGKRRDEFVKDVKKYCDVYMQRLKRYFRVV